MTFQKRSTFRLGTDQGTYSLILDDDNSHEVQEQTYSIAAVVYITSSSHVVDIIVIDNEFNCFPFESCVASVFNTRPDPRIKNSLRHKFTVTTGQCEVCQREDCQNEAEENLQKINKSNLTVVRLEPKKALPYCMNNVITSCAMYACRRSAYFTRNFMTFVERKSEDKSKMEENILKLSKTNNQKCVLDSDKVLVTCKSSLLLTINLSYQEYSYVNIAWCNRILELVAKRAMLEDCMAWLNTLGGGYSALGDYFEYHAEEAGKISFKQMKVALDMGDPPTVIRCKLYFSISLMQRGYLREAKRIIRCQYYLANHLPVQDVKLLAMCKGIWTKLQYLYARRNKARLKKKDKSIRGL